MGLLKFFVPPSSVHFKAVFQSKKFKNEHSFKKVPSPASGSPLDLSLSYKHAGAMLLIGLF